MTQVMEEFSIDHHARVQIKITKCNVKANITDELLNQIKPDVVYLFHLK
jgi:hypothetical protein